MQEAPCMINVNTAALTHVLGIRCFTSENGLFIGIGAQRHKHVTKMNSWLELDRVRISFDELYARF